MALKNGGAFVESIGHVAFCKELWNFLWGKAIEKHKEEKYKNQSMWSHQQKKKNVEEWNW